MFTVHNPNHMKTFTLKNKHIVYYADLQTSPDFTIIMQLYCIAKAEASVRKMPLLPLNDFRQTASDPSITMKQNKISFIQLVTVQLHALTDPLFKRTAA
ncbi:hypothetical protein BH10BAC2_BH10BAC2_31480 [soil metagenome]